MPKKNPDTLKALRAEVELIERMVLEIATAIRDEKAEPGSMLAKRMAVIQLTITELDIKKWDKDRKLKKK